MLLMSKQHFKKGRRPDFVNDNKSKGVESSNVSSSVPKLKKGVLEPNVFAYYQRCNQILNKENEFESDFDKVGFLKATFETLAFDGFKVLQNQTLSRVIESFLDYADFEMLHIVLQIFGKNWETSVTDRFAHRVLQKTLEVYQACLNVSAELIEKGNPPKFINEVVTLVSDFGAHMYENYPHYMEHQQASYILRAYLKVLSGVKVKVVDSKEEIELFTPGLSNYEAVFMDLSKNLLYSPHLKETISQPLPNLFIQTILTCLRYRFPKEMRKVVRYILEESNLLKDDDSKTLEETNLRIPCIFTNHQGCYFMERLVRLMSKKSFGLFVSVFITGKEEVLALDSRAGFILQRVIERADAELFQKLTKTLCRKLPDIFAENQIGLVHALAAAAEEFPDAQKRIVSALRRSLRCNGEDHEVQAAFFVCLTRMTAFGVESEPTDTSEESSSKEPQLHLHGCLIAQSILRYQKTGFIVRSILATSADELLRIGSDKMGNHIFEVLFDAPSISNDFKVNIVQQMETVLPRLACDRYGSRVMDCIWRNLDIDARSLVVQKLMPFKNKLRNDRFGYFVCRNFGLLIYHRKREWTHIQSESSTETGSHSEKSIKSKKIKQR